MKLTEILGTVTYQVREGKITHDFTLPDFTRLKVKKLETPREIEACALFSLWLENIFAQQQEFLARKSAGKKVSRENDIKFTAITSYLEHAMDHLTSLDPISLELVNNARVQIAAHGASAKQEERVKI